METEEILLHSSEDTHPMATVNCIKHAVPCHLNVYTIYMCFSVYKLLNIKYLPVRFILHFNE